MRRIITMLTGAIVVLGSVGTVSAAAPLKSEEHWLGVGCEPVASPLGYVFAGAWTSDLYGADAALDIFLEPANAGTPLIGRNWDVPAEVTFGDGTYAASIPLMDANGDAGTATIEGTWVVIPGTADEGSDRFRFGNRWVRSATAEEALFVTMTVGLPGQSPISVDPLSCGGGRGTTTTFESNPNAFTDRWAARETVCELENAEGATASMFLETFNDDDQVFWELSGTTAAGAGFSASYIGPFVGPRLTTAIDVFLTEPAWTQTDPGQLDITLLATDIDISYTIVNGTGGARVRGVALDVEGSVAAAATTFDLGACVGYFRDVKQLSTQPAGPGPGGKRPANDAPSGAVTLKPGDRKTVATRGTNAPIEVDMTCLTFEDPFGGGTIHAEGAHSVWYKVAGNGKTMTIDTAGSDYDTIVAVYAATADVANEVGCVDDVFFQPVGRTLQSAVTWAAAAGTTYWIQAGGLVDGVPYGTLKVALR